MEPLLDLPRDQFLAALAELQLDPERRDNLMRQYRRANSPFAPIYGLLARTAVEDAGEGMQRADIVPISRPEGMSVFDAVRSGEAQLAVPQGLLDTVNATFLGIDAPSAAYQGLIPEGDMADEGFGTAAVMMGLGGLLARPAGSLGTGGRVAPRSGDETPAQQVARLLREGRSDEVTDDLMAQADPQEMYQLYVSGQTGMDLPMDEASRMARAAEMGFDTGTPLYHGGLSDIDAFRVAPGSKTDHGWYGEGAYFGDADTASIYALNHPTINRPEGGNVIAAVGRGSTYEWPEGRPAALDAGEARAISQELTQSGYSGANVYAPNDPDVWGDAAGSFRERVIYDPRNIRSRFARFDPRLSHLANLNAANIDPLTGAAAMGASQQQQDPLASLRAYLAQNGLLSQ